MQPMIKEKGRAVVLMQDKTSKSVFKDVLVALDTYREVNKKHDRRTKEYSKWKEDARKSLDALLLVYFGFSESETIRRQRELLKQIHDFLDGFVDKGAVELRAKIEAEINH